MPIKEFLKKIVAGKETRAWIMQHLLCVIPNTIMIPLWYYVSTGKKLNLKHPVTLNEKIQWYKMYYHDDLMTRCADKYLVREYVKKCGLGYLLINQIGVYKGANEIDFTSLPEKCYIKCNHNSNGNIAFNKQKDNDIPSIRKHLNKMLKLNGYYSSREWCYKNIAPRIIVDECIENKRTGEGIIDINIFCFNGVPKLVLYNLGLVDEDGNHTVGKRAAFDENFNELDIKTAMEQLPLGSVQKPAPFDDMISAAKILSKPFPFVRVDFFYTVDRFYFGELTFYSAGGYGKYAPDSWNKIMGDWFILPDKKK